MARRRGLGLEFVEALPQDGERRLMLAVLIDAVRSVSAPHAATPHLRTHRELLRERAWFTCDDRARTFSFQNICDSLGLNADYIRRCVLKREVKPVRVRRYAAKAEESWLRQRKDRGLIVPTKSSRTATAAGRSSLPPTYAPQRTAVG